MGRRRAGANHSPILRAILIASALLLACCAPQPKKKKPEPAATKTARILQFYARDAVLPLGEKTLLCYGVDGAKTVHLAPAVDAVWPAFSRCIDIAPSKETTYTLTAEGEDGQPVAQSVTVKVGAPRPKIIEVSVNSLNVHAGEQVSVCYHVKNATSVKVVPGRSLNLAVASSGHGCWADRPARTTTYTVTAYGAGGATDTEHVTVHVK
ncbi:MAG TPA: hypothetical protein VGV35_13475 [Bryobacteraceae bacterium]|nr:hypothetical protein [Bryobacteraceae bacterium]